MALAPSVPAVCRPYSPGRLSHMGPRDAPVVVLQRGGMSRARGQTPFGYVEYKYEALEERGLTPLAKGLAGGVAIGAMIATEDVAAAFVPGTHASTFGGNPIATAAGLAALKAVLEDGVLDNCKKVGAYLEAKLNALKSKYTFIKEVRGKGLILGMELDEGIKAQLPDQKIR